MKYTYTFDQLQDNEAGRAAVFMSYEWTQKHGGVDQNNYFTADSGTIEAETELQACEKLFCLYNARYSLTGYSGRSMCVSDIVNLWDNERQPPEKTSWFCNTVGFVLLKGGEE